MRWPVRLAIAAASTLPIVMPVAWVLAAHVANVNDMPLVEPSRSREAVPIELSYLDYPGRPGAHTGAMVLQLQRPETLATHKRLDLLVATYDTIPRLQRATLTIEGTDCTFESRPGARYPNNGMLTLLRSKECARMTGAPTGRLTFEVRFNGTGRAGLWTYRAPADALDPARIYLSDPTYAEQGVLCEVRASYVDEFGWSNLRRIDLLAYVWHLGTDRPEWIWIALGICSALLATAAFAILSSPTSADSALRAIALGCAAGALAALYAVLVPPFQAADEPSHLLTVLDDIGRPELAAQATALARRGHFDRIHFHPDEGFRPVDRTTLGAPTNDGDASDALRGMGVRYLWRLTAPLTRSLDAAHVLLCVRLIHGVIFGLAVGIFVLLTAVCSDVQRPTSLALPLFLVPTLPFFAMYVSNYAPLSSVYVLLGAGVLVSMGGNARAHYGGAILGVGFILAVLISRSALPLTPFVLSLLVARILTGGGPNASSRSAFLFWTGTTVPIACGVWLLQADYYERLRHVLTVTFAKPSVPRANFVVLVLLAGAVGYLIERGAGRLSTRLEPQSTGRITPYVAGGLAALVAGVMVASMVWSPPVLQMIDPAHPPTQSAYIRAAVLAGLTFLRPGSPDFLTSVAFWQGFGWLDTIPSVALASLLATASGIALVSLLVQIAHARASRALVWICCAILGYAATLAAYAMSVIRLTPADLHGRYLLGLYLCMLLIAWSSVARLDGSNRRIAAALPPALALGCLAVHGWCLAAIVQRYF